MKHLFLLLMATSSICCHSASRDDAPLEITYIANEGFLIRTASKKVLIDALFNDRKIDYCDVPSEILLEKMEKGLAPFHDVDLILVTHAHRDHYSGPSVARYLRNNPESMLVCPEQAAEQLERECPFFEEISGRVREVSLALNDSMELRLDGIHVHAHRMRHCQYMEKDEITGEEHDRHEKMQNLVYLIDMGGRKILHMGDAVLELNRDYIQSLELEQQHITASFLEYFDSSQASKRIITENIKPEHIVFMHLPAQKDKVKKIGDHLRQEFSSAIIFEASMEKMMID